VFVQVLVDEQIQAGVAIRDELRKAGFPIAAAFWYRSPESGLWRLVIGSKLIDRIGPLEGYKRLHKVLDRVASREELSGNISLLSANDPEFQRLLQYTNGPGESRVLL
jgi:hypothetical protein